MNLYLFLSLFFIVYEKEGDDMTQEKGGGEGEGGGAKSHTLNG